MELSNQDIKEIISTSLSRSGINGSIETVIRHIIFSEANNVDWQKVWNNIVLEEMPEFRNENYLKIYMEEMRL